MSEPKHYSNIFGGEIRGNGACAVTENAGWISVSGMGGISLSVFEGCAKPDAVASLFMGVGAAEALIDELRKCINTVKANAIAGHMVIS